MLLKRKILRYWCYVDFWSIKHNCGDQPSFPPPLPPSLAAIINQLLQRAFIKYSEINFKQIFLGNFHVTYKAHTLAINQQFIDTKNSYFVLN